MQKKMEDLAIVGLRAHLALAGAKQRHLLTDEAHTVHFATVPATPYYLPGNAL